MKSSNCIECDGEPLILSEDLLITLSEEELEKYLKCEDYLKPNAFKREKSNTNRVHLLTS